MATTTTPAIFTLRHHPLPPTHHRYGPTSPSTFLPPVSTPKPNPRLRISHKLPILWKQSHGPTICCCNGDSGISPEPENDISSKESSIDIKLPRRSLLLQFTCDACGERTKKLINRVAYERGTVFVQCSGCLKHHKLIDNLGLVVEYDFRNDKTED